MRRLAAVLLILTLFSPARAHSAINCLKGQLSLRNALITMGLIAVGAAYYGEGLRKDRLWAHFQSKLDRTPFIPPRDERFGTAIRDDFQFLIFPTSKDPVKRAKELEHRAYALTHLGRSSVEGVNQLEKFTRENPEFEKMAESSGVNWNRLRKRSKALELHYQDFAVQNRPPNEKEIKIHKAYIDDILALAHYYEKLLAHQYQKGVDPENVERELDAQIDYAHLYKDLGIHKGKEDTIGIGRWDSNMSYLAVRADLAGVTPKQIMRGLVRYDPRAKAIQDDPARYAELLMFLDMKFHPEKFDEKTRQTANLIMDIADAPPPNEKPGIRHLAERIIELGKQP